MYNQWLRINYVKVLIEFYTESPGPPSDLSLTNVTNTSALLSWSPPDNGGGRPLSEIVYTATATGEYFSSILECLLMNNTAMYICVLYKPSVK